ncbi:proline-rich protein [Mycena sanguinolenta]|nr:proline-rich protein [Mycena sanguinolenta]
MPTFAELRDKAGKAKDATVKKTTDMKDRHTSVPLKSTNWDPYNKNPHPPPPPPPRANKHTKPTVQPSFPAPPQRGGSTAEPSAPSPGPGPPPIVRPSAAPGPPPIVRATRPSLPSSSSASTLPPPPVRAPVLSRFRQPEPEEEVPAATPPPPVRRVAARSAEKDIDWTNLSAEDKEVLFAWLDEFFSRHLNRPIGMAS